MEPETISGWSTQTWSSDQLGFSSAE